MFLLKYSQEKIEYRCHSCFDHGRLRDKNPKLKGHFMILDECLAFKGSRCLCQRNYNTKRSHFCLRRNRDNMWEQECRFCSSLPPEKPGFPSLQEATRGEPALNLTQGAASRLPVWLQRTPPSFSLGQSLLCGKHERQSFLPGLPVAFCDLFPYEHASSILRSSPSPTPGSGLRTRDPQ